MTRIRSFPPRRTVDKYRRQMRGPMPALFAAVEAQLRHITRIGLPSGYRPRSGYEVALWSHHARGTDAARAVVTLAECGHGELANAAARVGFETTVSALWLAIDGERRAELYERYTNREDYEVIRLLQSLGVRASRPRAEVRAIMQEKKTGAAAFQRGLGWTQLKLRKQCEQVAVHWKAPRALARLRRYASIATTLGNRASHAGAKDAVQRLRSAPDFAVSLGPHRLTHAYAGYALQTAAWSYGSLVYLVLRETGVADAAAWHDFFWPLIEACALVTGVHA